MDNRGTMSYRPKYQDPFYQVSRGWPVTARVQADSGDVEAQLYIAYMCFNQGHIHRSIYWYKAAASQGSVDAMLDLCALLENGTEFDIPADLAQACFWMKKMLGTAGVADGTSGGSGGVDKDNPHFYSIRDVMHRYGWYLLGAKTPKKSPPQQSLPIDVLDTAEGINWLEMAANAGHEGAASQLGNLYMTGQHPQIPRNPQKGMEYLKKAALLGNGQCAYQLAVAYKCVSVNHSLEKSWLQVAVQLGSNEAKLALLMQEAGDTFSNGMSTKEANRSLFYLDNELDIENSLVTDGTKNCSNPKCDKVEETLGTFPMCIKCRHVKYCSRKCQKIHFHAGHKKDCNKLEQSKKELIQDNRNIVFPWTKRCYNPECEKKATSSSPLLRCKGCQNARYCSLECHKKHWKAGHKQQCQQAVADRDDANRLLAELAAKKNESRTK